jgi:hypothetical protein
MGKGGISLQITSKISQRTVSVLVLLTAMLLSFGCGGGGGGGGEQSPVGMSLDGVTPANGPIVGGTACTIKGNSFSSEGITVVTFGSVSATDVVVEDEYTITCITPAHAAGSVDVSVVNSLGETANLPKGFSYRNAPSVGSLLPSRGPEDGGTEVTVTGSGFTRIGSTKVFFGVVEATDVTVVNGTTITCTTPANTLETVDVTVSNDFGSGILGGGFYYFKNIVVGSINPNEGNVVGGTACTITGNYFITTGETRVVFDEIEATDVVVVNDTTITCAVPPHSAAAVDVTVVCDNGSDSLDNGFTYHNLEEISPESGPMTGGTTVTIAGTDFTASGETVVTFGGVSALNIVVVNNTTITCDTPPAAQSGAVDVSVANVYGYDTLPGAFTYGTAPIVSNVTPAHGFVAGGTSVTIIGSNFTTSQGTTVTFGGSAATNVVVVDSATITCETPAHAAGFVDVAVASSNGSGVLQNGFEYLGPPDIQSVSPNSGSMAGGTAVTISGTGFSTFGTTTVTFGGLAATDVVVASGVAITCTTPAHGEGVVDVAVTNDFGSDTLAAGYTFNSLPPPPSISGLLPEHGVAGGGTAVTITGADFTTSVDTTVTFGGTQAGNVVVVDSSTVTCTTPAHGAGAADVVVTNSNGSDTLTDGFTFHNSPGISLLSPENGPVEGGTAVTITGSDFTTVGATTVTFGGIQATQIVVLSATTITCEAPAQAAAGSVDVTVSNDFGSDTLGGGYNYYGEPTLSNLNCVTNGSSVDLTWTLDDPGLQIDEIVVSRGSAELARTAGTAQSYQFTEGAYGYFRYTVEIVDGGAVVDSEDLLVHLGKIKWDLPATAAHGFYLYLADAVGDPYLVLPYSAPGNYSYDVNSPVAKEISLEILYDAGLIGTGVTQGVDSYYLAASSYLVWSPTYRISVLTAPVTFDFEVAIDTP